MDAVLITVSPIQITIANVQHRQLFIKIIVINAALLIVLHVNKMMFALLAQVLL